MPGVGFFAGGPGGDGTLATPATFVAGRWRSDRGADLVDGAVDFQTLLPCLVPGSLLHRHCFEQFAADKFLSFRGDASGACPARLWPPGAAERV